MGWRRSTLPRFTPDGRRIVLSGSEANGAVVVRSVDLESGQVAALPIPDADQPCRVVSPADGDYLFCSMTDPGLFEYSGRTATARSPRRS